MLCVCTVYILLSLTCHFNNNAPRPGASRIWNEESLLVQKTQQVKTLYTYPVMLPSPYPTSNELFMYPEVNVQDIGTGLL